MIREKIFLTINVNMKRVLESNIKLANKLSI